MRMKWREMDQDNLRGREERKKRNNNLPQSVREIEIESEREREDERERDSENIYRERERKRSTRRRIALVFAFAVAPAVAPALEVELALTIAKIAASLIQPLLSATYYLSVQNCEVFSACLWQDVVTLQTVYEPGLVENVASDV